MLSWLNRRLRNRMSGGVRGRKFPNQRNFLLLDQERERKAGSNCFRQKQGVKYNCREGGHI